MLQHCVTNTSLSQNVVPYDLITLETLW